MNPVAQKYGAAHLAGINLIPVEIAERKRMRTFVSMAVISVLGAIALVILAFLAAFTTRQAAQGDLDDALAAQTAAVADRDGKAGIYRDVQERESAEYALAQIGFGEMDYAQLTSALQSVTNDDTSFDLFEVAGPSAAGLGGGAQDGVFRGGVGTFLFEARATSFESATALIERMEAIPGIAQVRGTAEYYDADGSDFYFRVEGAGVITDLRLTGRLTPEGGISGVDALTLIAEQDPEQFPIPVASPSAEATPSPSPSASEEG